MAQYTQQFTVINSQVADLQKTIELDGQPAVVTFKRCVLEADASEAGEKTLTLVLPPEAAADFAEGTSITLTIEPTPAPDTGA